MEVFQAELPRVFAERLDSSEALDAHRVLLNEESRDGSYELEGDSIIHVTYRSSYGDSVDEFRRPLVGLGAWVVWSSSRPKLFHYVYTDQEVFTVDLVPSKLVDELQLELKPFRVERPRGPKDSEPGLW